MRKIFTFLFAALMSVGMFATTVTWDAATIAALNLEAGGEFTKDNVKLTVNTGASVSGGNFYGNSSKAFTFSLTNDQAIYSIVVTSSSHSVDAAGWKEPSSTAATWIGNATSVDYGYSFSGVSSIVFTIGPWVLEGDAWDEATKTLTVNSNPREAAYMGRTEIEHLIISDAVTSIGDAAFFRCSKISSLTFGNSVESIGYSAFGACAISSVELPASIQSIGEYAFTECSQLVSLTCNAVNPPTLGNTAFWFSGSLAHIYVPAGSVDNYKGATNWSAKASIIEAIGGGSAENPIVVFEANGNRKEVSVELPHTFVCDSEYKDGELDVIIQELYALQGGYCDFFNAPIAAGNAVTAGLDDDANHFITISEAFEGMAMVRGSYYNLDDEEFTYTLTISIKGEGGATGIDEIVNRKSSNRKFIKDGQLLIEKNGKFYNATGAEVR